MPWHSLGKLRVDRKVKELWVNDQICREQIYRDAVDRLQSLLSVNYHDLTKLIRSKGAVPAVSVFNKFGLMLQVIEVEFGEEVARMLEHYLDLRTVRH